MGALLGLDERHAIARPAITSPRFWEIGSTLSPCRGDSLLVVTRAFPTSDAPWAFLDAFTVRGLDLVDVPTWNALDALRADAARAAGAKHAELVKALADWDEALQGIGGEPAFKNWGRFHPLRLSREEDWSDWLAHLIETSGHGFLAFELLARSDARVERVDREVATAEGFRADLVVHWNDGFASHVEVKVGDLSFKKTFGTAVALRKRFGHTLDRWTDHILVPDRHSTGWQQEADKHREHAVQVGMLTWTDIAVALRRSIRAGREPIDWRVWAATFVGAIEQTLVGLPVQGKAPSGPAGLAQLLRASTHLELLGKALRHE